MAKTFPVTLDQLAEAHAAYRANEPRELHYRVAQTLAAQAWADQGDYSLAEAVEVLLLSWNLGYYRRARVPFVHAEIAALIEANAAGVSAFRDRPIESLVQADLPEVERLFMAFRGVVGRVGAAKALHVLAPRFFALWDNPIAKGYRFHSLNPSDYRRLMCSVAAQARMVGGEAGFGRGLPKAIDELNYCRFTLQMDFGPLTWIEAWPFDDGPSRESTGATLTTEPRPRGGPTAPVTHRDRPTFDEVFARLQTAGPATLVSSRGTKYRVAAQVSSGTKLIVARPRSGQVRIHTDCWGDDVTCQGTRAGGIYHGAPSIFDWYESSKD